MAWEQWNTFTPGPIVKLDTVDSLPMYMHRLDLLHSWADGNKYYKLKYTLREALQSGARHLVSKGGMFSNHLAALASACSVFGFRCTAVVRSYIPDEQNPTLQRLRSSGVEVVYLNPDSYKTFDEATCRQQFPDALFIPEGGLTRSGIHGASDITQEWEPQDKMQVIVPAGSLATAAGILSKVSADVHVSIIPAWKGCSVSYVAEVLKQFDIQPVCTWDVWRDYHFGGFGKFTPDLPAFMTSFFKRTGVVLDPVYTGKMMYALYDRIGNGHFPKSSKIMAIHTGGLQGIEGFRYRYPDSWGEYADLVSDQRLPRH